MNIGTNTNVPTPISAIYQQFQSQIHLQNLQNKLDIVIFYSNPLVRIKEITKPECLEDPVSFD